MDICIRAKKKALVGAGMIFIGLVILYFLSLHTHELLGGILAFLLVGLGSWRLGNYYVCLKTFSSGKTDGAEQK